MANIYLKCMTCGGEGLLPSNAANFEWKCCEATVTTDAEGRITVEGSVSVSGKPIPIDDVYILDKRYWWMCRDKLLPKGVKRPRNMRFHGKPSFASLIKCLLSQRELNPPPIVIDRAALKRFKERS